LNENTATVRFAQQRSFATSALKGNNVPHHVDPEFALPM